jgi:predicted nucleotidyltransferase
MPKPPASSTPAFFLWLTETIRDYGWIKSVRLFGSRAREDHQPTSDYDLAFELASDKPGIDLLWAGLCETLRERNPTLNTLDLVRMDEIGDDFRAKILSEGKVLVHS